jgi:hypothetical protein
MNAEEKRESQRAIIKISPIPGGLKYTIVEHPHFEPGSDARQVYVDLGWELVWVLEEFAESCEVELKFHAGEIALFSEQQHGPVAHVKVADTIKYDQTRFLWLEVKYTVIVHCAHAEDLIDDPEMIIKPGGTP